MERALNWDTSPEFVSQIIEEFEGFLESREIDIWNPEKEDAIDDGEDPGCIANLYGTDYGEIQSGIEETLVRWNLLPNRGGVG